MRRHERTLWQRLRGWWHGNALWEEITEIEVALIEQQQRLEKIELVLGGK